MKKGWVHTENTVTRPLKSARRYPAGRHAKRKNEKKAKQSEHSGKKRKNEERKGSWQGKLKDDRRFRRKRELIQSRIFVSTGRALDRTGPEGRSRGG